MRVKLFYATMRALEERMVAKGAFLVSATRLGGEHGYDERGAVAPLGGAVTGFTKAWKREHADALVKAVDFDASRKTAELADILLEETRRDPGIVEVGHRDGLRFSVGLDERPAADGRPGMALGAGERIPDHGCGGGDRLRHHRGSRRGLWGHVSPLRSRPRARPRESRPRPLPRGQGRPEARDLRADEGEGRARHAGDGREGDPGRSSAPSPRSSPSRRIRRAGGRAFWYACDLRDGAAVERACADVRARSPRVDVLLHGAGLEISRFLKDKEPREFDLVFDVKSDGWFNVLKGLGDTPIGATVAFSSIAGRFGNGGQTDYSAANDLLCKTTSSFRTTRPATRGLVVDWTAWADIGMASRGSIPQNDGARGHRHAARRLRDPRDPARAHGGRSFGGDRDRGPPRCPRGRVGRDGRARYERSRRARSSRRRGARLRPLRRPPHRDRPRSEASRRSSITTASRARPSCPE